MSLVRLFYNSIDVQPSVLIHHFIHYLGFYIEEITEKQNNKNNISIADIYIISNNPIQKENIQSLDEEKTIFILKDKLKVDEHLIRCISYNDDTEYAFLCKLLDNLSDITNNKKEYKTLLQNDDKQIAKFYTDNRLLQASLFTRYFYKQKALYGMAMEFYSRFLHDMDEYSTDLFRYAKLYAKYEVNLICKRNSLGYHFNSDELLNECENLLKDYTDNEELHLLRAGILYELQENYAQALEYYGDIEIKYCTYAKFQRGKILGTYYNEYNNAIRCLEQVDVYSSIYCKVLYQLGKCYDNQRQYDIAIETFHKIYSYFREKYIKHLLSPLELEYMYKSVMQIAIICKMQLGDYKSAYVYNDLANEIIGNMPIDKYIHQVWKEAEEIEGLIPEIKKTVKENIKIDLDRVY